MNDNLGLIHLLIKKDNNMNELIEKLKGLDGNELGYVILELMLSGNLNYTDFTKFYVRYLNIKSNEQRMIIAGMSVPLIHYWEKNKDTTKNNLFFRCKAAYSLLKSNMFKGASIEADLIKIVKDNNYSEDEHGIHSINK